MALSSLKQHVEAGVRLRYFVSNDTGLILRRSALYDSHRFQACGHMIGCSFDSLLGFCHLASEGL